VAGRPLVIKRYNIKNTAHWLKRFWRPSRAWHSWREGNRLAFLGIATPAAGGAGKALFGLRSRAYLVTEYLPGPDIIERFAPYVEQRRRAGKRAAGPGPAVCRADWRAHQPRRLQGPQPVLAQGRWALIDLDAMCQHTSTASFAPAYAKDRARFMRNWPQDSGLYRVIDQRLPEGVQAGGSL
jgi:hypothetical protein